MKKIPDSCRSQACWGTGDGFCRPRFQREGISGSGLVGAKPAQSGETAYLREDATRPAARKGMRAANELEGGDSMATATEPTTSGLAEPKASAGKKERSLPAPAAD